MNSTALVNTLCDLVAIPSCSHADGGNEGDVQAYVERRMRDAGARVRTFEPGDVPAFFDHPVCCGPQRQYMGRPTILGEIGPDDAPALLVLAHSDVVSINNEPERWTADPFEPVVRDGRVYGRGAGDDKWGVASVLTLLETLVDTNLKKRIIFASTIDEENGVSNGLLLLHLAGVEAEAALYLDGCGMKVVTGNLGGSNLYLRPKQAIGIERMQQHADQLETTCRAISAARSDLFDGPILSINDTRHSSVCFRAELNNDAPFLMIPFYTLPGEDGDELVEQIEAAVHRALGSDAAQYDFSYRTPWFEPTMLDADHPWVNQFAASYRNVAKREAVISCGSKQDSFVLRKYARIPTISFGVSRFEGPGAIHQPDEYIDIDDAWLGWRIARQAISDWLEST